MTMKKKKQLLCEDNLRHNEYYGMQNTIDNLYQASLNGEVFTDLMSVILQRENILLAYRNIKKNTGSKTNGTDNLTIEDIGRCSPDEVVEKVRFIINGSEHGYRPKPVRRKEIPKPYDPSKTRPLGIPCIWDRLVQQCIKCFLASNFPHFHRYDSLKSALYIHAVSKNINTFPKNQGRIRSAIAVEILDFTVMYR